MENLMRSILCKLKFIWLLTFCFSTSVFATSHHLCGINIGNFLCLHPILSIGGGAAISSDIGNSKTFPIVNPLTDEFYIYSANHPTQTVGVFDVFVGTEQAFNPNWLLQIGLDYNQTGNFYAKGLFIQGADAQSADQYSYRYTILTRQLLAEGKLLHRFRESFLPYILLGIGSSFNEASDYQTNVPPFLTFTREYKNYTQNSFTYTIGVGLDVNVLPCLRIGVGYRFVDFGQITLGKATIDTTSVGGSLSQEHLYANEILAQITWVLG